jgi:D-tyrosyl-tRNA(Tyr) deacylase
MNLDLRAVGGSLLAISQFTLAASTSRGRRPSFDFAMQPAQAQPLFESFVDALRALNIEVATGRFGAAMQVELTNDGPVTLALQFP